MSPLETLAEGLSFVVVFGLTSIVWWVILVYSRVKDPKKPLAPQRIIVVFVELGVVASGSLLLQHWLYSDHPELLSSIKEGYYIALASDVFVNILLFLMGVLPPVEEGDEYY